MKVTTETMEQTWLDGLIARLEKAEGPEANLDLAIWMELCWKYPWREIASGTPFTASIDAALALVEKVLPGAVWTKNQHDQVALSRYPTKPMIIGMGWHHHVPIAILIALLHAIKSRESAE